MKTTTNPETLYTFAESCASVAIRARHEKSGLDLLRQLQNARANDQTARNAADIASRADSYTSRADEHTATADTLTAIAHRISTPDTERTEASREAAAHRAEAKRERAAADILTAELSRAYSDRADLVQAALLALCELTASPAPVLTLSRSRWTYRPAKSAAAAACILCASDPDDRAALRSDIWRACTNAAGRAINAAASPDALNSTTTKASPASPADVAAWIAKHGATGPAVKEAQTVKRCRASECFDTMEFRNRKTAPGWYRVRHWVTVAPYTSIDALNESGDITGYFRSYNPFAETQGTAERLEAMQTAAVLTERERAFIAAFTSTTAAKHGATARQKYHDTTTADTSRKESRAAADMAEYTAMLDYAFSAIGIKSADSRRQFMKRIRDRLAAAPLEQTTETRAEYDERTRRHWERIQGNRARAYHIDRAPRPDCLAWIDRAESAPAAPVISWLTAEEAKARRAAQAAPDTSAKPANFDARCICAAVDRWTAAVTALSLPAAGQTAASIREAERIARAASRHPNTTPETLTTPESPKAAHERRMHEQWDRYFDATPRRTKAAPMADADRAAVLAALNTPEKCAERLAAMKSRREYLFGK